MQNKKLGFTLVEIMIVVAIVALLAAIAIPNLIRAKISANEAAAQANLKLISNALENYAAINNNYPVQTTLLIGVTPPYLSVDYFTGVHNGYNFTPVLSLYSYTITAAPISSNVGTTSFTITTSGILSSN